MTQLTEKSTPEEREGLLEKEERREEEQEEIQEGEEGAQGEEHEEEEKEEDSRFHQPTPSPFKRILLILFIAFFFWLAFVLGRARMLRNKKPQVVYAKRYDSLSVAYPQRNQRLLYTGIPMNTNSDLLPVLLSLKL